MPIDIINIENIISQAIAGILTVVAVWMYRSLVLRLRKVIKAEAIKEVRKISFNTITYFLPLIASLVILVVEVWLINPYSIIDFIFIIVAIWVLVGNLALAIFAKQISKLLITLVRTRIDLADANKRMLALEKKLEELIK